MRKSEKNEWNLLKSAKKLRNFVQKIKLNIRKFAWKSDLFEWKSM